MKVSGRRRWMSVDATAGYGALTWVASMKMVYEPDLNELAGVS